MSNASTFDIHKKLRQLMKERNWSEYRLAKESGLSQSTIANIFRRNTMPSIQTIIAICDGLEISIAQFFSEGDFVELTAEEKTVLDVWHSMSYYQRQSFFAILQSTTQSPFR